MNAKELRALNTLKLRMTFLQKRLRALAEKKETQLDQWDETRKYSMRFEPMRRMVDVLFIAENEIKDGLDSLDIAIDIIKNETSTLDDQYS